MRIFTLYLSTQTTYGPYVPINEDNKASVTWNINWNDLYGSILNKDEERRCRVKFQLTSLSQNGVFTWADNSGIIVLQGMSNNNSNSQNGLILGNIQPIDNPVAGHPNHIMIGDTLQTAGVMSVLPYGYQPITIKLLDRTGAHQPNMVDYQIILQFEVDENI
jgi:hypothetical protein